MLSLHSLYAVALDEPSRIATVGSGDSVSAEVIFQKKVNIECVAAIVGASMA